MGLALGGMRDNHLVTAAKGSFSSSGGGSAKEAKAVAEAGVDAVIAQGVETGGI